MVFFCLVLTATATRVFSQTPNPNNLINEDSIIVSPVYYEQVLSPGEEKKLDVKITNNSPRISTMVYPLIHDFTTDPNEGGQPQLLPVNEETAKYSLKRWIDIKSDPISLKPKERAFVPFTIKVPRDAEPGSHWGMVVFSGENPKLKGGNEVGVSSEIGIMILVNVEGPSIKKGQLLDFFRNLQWYENPPIIFTTRIQNVGTVHFKPLGVIEIKSLITGKKKTVLQVNEAYSNVLPDSIKRFENIWKPKGFFFIPPMGKFQAQLTLSLESSDNTVTRRLAFWIIPWRFLLLVFLILIFFLILLKILINKYNNWIIKKALRKQSSS